MLWVNEKGPIVVIIGVFLIAFKAEKRITIFAVFTKFRHRLIESYSLEWKWKLPLNCEFFLRCLFRLPYSQLLAIFGAICIELSCTQAPCTAIPRTRRRGAQIDTPWQNESHALSSLQLMRSVVYADDALAINVGWSLIYEWSDKTYVALLR